MKRVAKLLALAESLDLVTVAAQDGALLEEAAKEIRLAANPTELPPSDEPEILVYFFREGGKWYTHEWIPWPYPYNTSNMRGHYLPQMFRETVIKHVQGRLSGMHAVCLAFPDSMSFPCLFMVP